MIRVGLPIPSGFVIPFGVSDDQLPALTAAVCGMFTAPHEQTLAVRPSAGLEDGQQASFTGVHATRFAQAEPDALLQAAREIRASAHTLARPPSPGWRSSSSPCCGPARQAC